MDIEIKNLDADQVAILEKLAVVLLDLGQDFNSAAKKKELDKTTIWAIRTSIAVVDEMFDEMSEENQNIFEFLTDGTASKLKKV